MDPSGPLPIYIRAHTFPTNAPTPPLYGHRILRQIAENRRGPEMGKLGRAVRGIGPGGRLACCRESRGVCGLVGGFTVTRATG